MQKLKDLLSEATVQANVQAFEDEGKDTLIHQLKSEKAELLKQLETAHAKIAELSKVPIPAPLPKPKPVVVAPIKKKPQVWAKGTKISDTLVNWALHVDAPLDYDFTVSISHTDVATGELGTWGWTIAKGNTVAAADYGYVAGSLVEYIVNDGNTYEVQQPRRVEIQLSKTDTPIAAIDTKPAVEYPNVNVNFGKPFSITKGGTYRGDWESKNTEVPAVEIKTNEKVIIEDSTVAGAGYLIKSWYNNADITIRNTAGYGLEPTKHIGYKKPRRFLAVSEFMNVVVENCYMESTAGIIIADARNGGENKSVKIKLNKVKNIDGRVFGGVDFAQFVQFDIRGELIFSEICHNEIVNEYGKCQVEDNINIHNTRGKQGNPIKIYGNLIHGAFYHPSTNKAYTGGGILPDGNAPAAKSSAWMEVFDNYLIGVGNYSLGIAGGNNMKYYNNFCVNASKLEDGRRYQDINTYASGMWAKDYYNAGNTFNNLFENNTIGVLNGNVRNDGSESAGAEWKGTIHLANPITRATEQAYIQKWRDMMSSKGYTTGAGK